MRRFYFDWLMSGSGIGVSGMLSLMFGRLLIALIIIFALAFLFNGRSKTCHTNLDGSIPQHPADLLSILNERLAKGEITIEEYERLKREILNK